MTLEQIAKLRMQRKFDTAAFVTIWLDCGYQAREEKHELAFEADATVGRIDLRPLVGLSVAIHANEYSERLVRLCERVKEHAAFVLVAIAGFDEDLGWCWSRLHGDMAL